MAAGAAPFEGCRRGAGAGVTEIAMALQRWMRRERLRPHQVAKASGLSRAHVGLILHDRVVRPGPDTLRRLATGLATDPYDGSLDADKRAQALADLSIAASYADLSLEAEPGSIRAAAIAAGLGDQPARFYETLMLEYPDPNPTTQDLVRQILERFKRRPQGDDVTDWLLEQFGPDGAALNGVRA
jgi:transcriptional regulator with XRE-family HTH domain